MQQFENNETGYQQYARYEVTFAVTG